MIQKIIFSSYAIDRAICKFNMITQKAKLACQIKIVVKEKIKQSEYGELGIGLDSVKLLETVICQMKNDAKNRIENYHFIR